MRISDPGKALPYTPIKPTLFTIAAGVAGWVDTDVSATTGVDQGRIWLVSLVEQGFASQGIGIRTHGSAVDAQLGMGIGAQCVNVDSAGHVDLYRNAVGATNYYFMGYFG